MDVIRSNRIQGSILAIISIAERPSYTRLTKGQNLHRRPRFLAQLVERWCYIPDVVSPILTEATIQRLEGEVSYGVS